MSYDAFISYSHGSDTQIAESLEGGLQRLAKPWYRRRALHVFRDKSALSANPGLWSSITEAMEESEHLVVCCSPDAAASPWVDREIAHWREHKPTGRIMLALTGGALVWSEALGGFDPAASTALPASLAGAFVEEPLFVDMRWAAGLGVLTLDDARFRDQIADLGAPMHGVPKEELVGEEIRQHRRALRLAIGAAFALALLTVATVVGAVFAVQQAHKAERAAQRELDAKKLLLGAYASLTDAKRKTAAERRLANAAQHDANVQGKRATDAFDRFNTVSAQAKIIQEQADASQQQANQANAALVVDQQRAVTAQNQAYLAQLNATSSQQSANAAQAAANLAVQGQGVAEANAARAAANAAVSAADATQTRAAVLSQRVAASNSSLDSSLLLATAATRMTGTDASSQADARSALASALDSAKSVHGFFAFPGDLAPNQIGKVAVSTDGKYVAAAEDSGAIQENGGHTTRLFVWHASDPTRVHATVWTSDLGCVSDLQWTKSDELISVDNAAGCLIPQHAATETMGAVKIEFVTARVRVWDGPHKFLDIRNAFGFDPVARYGTSPFELSPDRRFVAINLDTGSARPNGAPISLIAVIDTLDSAKGDLLFMQPGAFYGQPTFSPSGRYLLGFDELKGDAAVWDLHTFQLPRYCNPKLEPYGCFLEKPLASNGWEIISMSPDERYVAFETGDGDVMKVVDLSGRAPAQTLNVPAGVAGFALGNANLAVSDLQGATQLIALPTMVSTNLSVHVDPSKCVGDPSFSQTGNEFFLGQLCTNQEDTQTSVFDLGGRLRKTLAGEIVASADDRRIVSQVFVVSPTSFHIAFELWDFSAATTNGVLVDARANEQAVASPDGTTVIGYPYPFLGIPAGSAQVWTVNGTEPTTVIGSFGVRNVTFLDNHRYVGFGSTTSGIEWDTAKAAYQTLYDTPASPCPDPASGDPTDTLLRSALSPDGKLRAVSTDARSIAIVDLTTHRTLTVVRPALGLHERIDYLAWSRGAGLQLLVNRELPNPHPLGDDLRCRNGVPTGVTVVHLRSSSGAVFARPATQRFEDDAFVTSSGDGARLLFRSIRNGSLVVRDAVSLRDVGARFVPSGLPGSSVHTNVYTLDMTGGRIGGTDPKGFAMIWSDDGRVLASASQLNPGTVQSNQTLGLVGIAFSPDGRRLAVKTVDQHLLVYDLKLLGAAPRRTKLPIDTAARVIWSPDGSLIAVDGIYVLDASSLQEIVHLKPDTWNSPILDQGTQAMRFVRGPGGVMYLDAERYADTAAARWRVDLGGFQAEACSVVGRNFTRDEFALYKLGGSYGATPCPGLPVEER